MVSTEDVSTLDHVSQIHAVMLQTARNGTIKTRVSTRTGKPIASNHVSLCKWRYRNPCKHQNKQARCTHCWGRMRRMSSSCRLKWSRSRRNVSMLRFPLTISALMLSSLIWRFATTRSLRAESEQAVSPCLVCIHHAPTELICVWCTGITIINACLSTAVFTKVWPYLCNSFSHNLCAYL